MPHIWTDLVTTSFTVFVLKSTYLDYRDFLCKRLRHKARQLLLHFRKTHHVKYFVLTSSKRVVLGRCFGVKAAIKTEVF